jgi:hypothetical protein
MDFIAIIKLTPSDPNLKPMFLSRIKNANRLASTPPKDLDKNTVQVRYFHVSKPTTFTLIIL